MLSTVALCQILQHVGKKGRKILLHWDVRIVMATSMIGTTEHALCWPAVHRGALLSLHRVVSLSVFPPKSQCCGTSERALASLSHWYSVMPAPCWTPYIGLQRQDTVCVLWRDSTNTEEKDIIGGYEQHVACACVCFCGCTNVIRVIHKGRVGHSVCVCEWVGMCLCVRMCICQCSKVTQPQPRANPLL